jgi:pyruvate kinase
MAEIARIAEGSELFGHLTDKFHLLEGEGILHATVRAACVAAEDVKARAIIPFTASGWTAFLVAGQRPRIPVIACTYNPSATNASLCVSA